jgi:hypothetical protein
MTGPPKKKRASAGTPTPARASQNTLYNSADGLCGLSIQENIKISRFGKSALGDGCGDARR